MDELWKTLKYHDKYYDNYEVSTLGNIRHKINKRNRKLQIDNKGYCGIIIHEGTVDKKKKQKSIKLHIAVASTFLDNPENKPTVNHIDGNKQNNCIDNLEWATMCEQIQHAYNVLGYRQLHSDVMRKTFSKKIAQYNQNNNLVKIWNSTREVEYSLNFRHEHIAACARGKRHSAYGYYWKYVDK